MCDYDNAVMTTRKGKMATRPETSIWSRRPRNTGCEAGVSTVGEQVSPEALTVRADDSLQDHGNTEGTEAA